MKGLFKLWILIIVHHCVRAWGQEETAAGTGRKAAIGGFFSLLSCVVLTYECSTYLWVVPPTMGWALPQQSSVETIAIGMPTGQFGGNNFSQLSQDENKTQLKYPISCQLDTQKHHCKIITISFLIVSKILWLHFTQNAVELYTSQLSLKVPNLSVENCGRQF